MSEGGKCHFRKRLLGGMGWPQSNEIFSYYEGGVSSVYFWDLDDGFAGVVLLKKSMYIERVLARAYRKTFGLG